MTSPSTWPARWTRSWPTFAGDLGRAAYSFIPRGAPPLLVGAAVFGLAMPAAPLPYVLGAVSLLLAIVVSFACRWLVNLAAFRLLDLRGVMTLYVLGSGLLSGHLLPVHWFPAWVARVGGERVLTLDLREPSPPLDGVPGTKLVAVEPDGRRQRLSFSPDDTTAAAVLADVGNRADVRDQTIDEPDIEDVVRRLYLSA